MTTDEATTRRPGHPAANGRHVPTETGDRAGVVASTPPDPVATEATDAKRPKRPALVATEATDAKRPSRFKPFHRKATSEATDQPKRPDRAKRPDRPKTTKTKRPVRPGRLFRRRRDRESIEAQARRAWLDDRGAAVGLPRGHGLAFLALLFTTVVSGGSAFWFVFGNVTDTAALFGVPWAQQRAVSPVLDAIVLGVTVVVQYLVMANGPADVIRTARRVLVGASALMLVVNAGPPVAGALTTNYAGPVMRATHDFTPAYDQMTAGQLWGRALFDVIIVGGLVVWSHVGPKFFRGMADIKARADRAALRQVEERTFATGSDRAEADRLRREATALLDRARAEAADLVKRARAQAAAVVASAQSEATALLDQAAADRRAAESAARSAGDTTAEATSLRERAERQAAAIVAEAEQLTARARATIDDERAQIAADRRDVHDVRAQLDRDRDQLTADRRALEQLADEITSTPAPAPSMPKPTKGVPASGKGAAAKPASGRAPRRPRSEAIPAGVQAWKVQHGADWWKVDPKKADIQTIAGVHGVLAIEIRREIVREGKGAAASVGETYAYQ